MRRAALVPGMYSSTEFMSTPQEHSRRCDARAGTTDRPDDCPKKVSALTSKPSNEKPSPPCSAFDTFVQYEKQTLEERLKGLGEAVGPDDPAVMEVLVEQWKCMARWQKSVYRELAEGEKTLHQATEIVESKIPASSWACRRVFAIGSLSAVAGWFNSPVQ